MLKATFGKFRKLGKTVNFDDEILDAQNMTPGKIGNRGT